LRELVSPETKVLLYSSISISSPKSPLLSPKKVEYNKTDPKGFNLNTNPS
jgi:hypothetical protein